MKPRGVFSVQKFKNRNKSISFRVTGTKLDGTRVRMNYPSETEALAGKQELEVEALNFIPDRRITTTRLTVKQEAEAEAAYAALERIGHGTLLGAVEYFGRNYRDPLKRIPVAEAAARFLKEKESANRRARYLKDLEQELGYLTAKHGSKPVHEVQKEDLVEVIEMGQRGAERQNNIRKDYRTFFNWCMANGFAQSNPAELVPVKTVERGEISTLSVEKVRELMRVTAGYKEGKLVPYVALAAFCAIRPDELARLSWDQIDLQEKQVTITASAAKKRGRRVVDMPENCVAWLHRHARKSKAIKGANWRKDFDWIKARIGFGNPERMPQGKDGVDKEKWAHLAPWPQDVLRHTGISCHYRLHGDEARTASWAGNSPDMIHAHYRALVSAKDAAAFFEIMPAEFKAAAKKGKIVDFQRVQEGAAEGGEAAAG